MKTKTMDFFYAIFKSRRNKIILGIGVLFLAVLITITLSLNFDKEIRSVEIESSGWQEKDPGSWHIDKSAEWTGLTTAKVTFDFDSVMKASEKKYDVIFVLDVSGSMEGDKLRRVKEDSIELLNYLFGWGDNRVAFITFSDTAEILSGFSNDNAELTSLIQGIQEKGSTNYKAGLELVDEIMEGYEPESDRKLVTLFLTDGFPNVDTPNEVAEYEYLKQKYPYMSINGVQYEMGTDIVEEIKRISDEQFYADSQNLENVLFDASVSPVPYEKLQIVDYVKLDRFYVKSVNDIKVSFGTVELDEKTQMITWNLDGHRTGREAKMEINLHLTDEFIEDGHPKEGFYPTNEKEEITHKLPEEPEVETPSDKTPVLKAPYLVIYDLNTPDECKSNEEIIEKHYAYENVTKRSEGPSTECPGYQFKGWQLDDKESVNPENGEYDILYVNDDIFTMPQHDVTLRGIWTKLDISKSMDGTIHEKLTLYKQIVNQNTNNSTNSGVRNYNIGNNKIYYYYRQNNTANALNNNVLFADLCWNIIRTTETGGVKLLYNGKPTAGSCDNSGSDSLVGSSAYNTFDLGPNRVTDFPHTYNNSMAYAGYMYNPDTAYPYKSLLRSSSTNVTQTLYFSSLEYIGTTGGYFADSFVENADGTYSLKDYSLITTSSLDATTSYSTLVKNKYYCEDMRQAEKCNSIKYITAVSKSGTNYQLTYYKGYKYGNSVEYNSSTNKYTLKDVKTLFDYSSTSGKNTFVNNHYTCFTTGTECSEVNYVFGTGSVFTVSGSAQDTIVYYELKSGDTIETIINKMLSEGDINKEDSVIKKLVDSWFKENLTNETDSTKKDYREFIEDTIYCNDRSIRNMGSFNPNGGSVSAVSFSFKDSLTSSYSFTCANLNDKFTVNSENGNGKLKYPVGLITYSEMYIGGTAFKNSDSYRTMSPYSFNSSQVTVACSGNASTGVNSLCGIRPVISLIPDIGFSTGDGSTNYPYVIDLEEE